ncbi:MAG: hypothetical protein KBB65_09750 [Syntrophorhabdaceae bacterium]|nr:hypothetical protein [Syntrophorhabdaceae bacterium]
MAELYSVGKKANKETADEIIAGLEAMGNYVPASEVIRRDYRNVLLKEYEEFIEIHDREIDNKMTPPSPGGGAGQ